MKIDNLGAALEDAVKENPQWRKTSKEGLDLDYCLLLCKSVADELFTKLEDTVQYYDGDLTKVRVFGKWHQIPRQQVAYGDHGVNYQFSGVTIPAKPWIEPLKTVKELISKVTGYDYNFVLVNRYRNGSDRIGEHKDGEAELDPEVPIASLSLGQLRQFVLRHESCKKKGPERRNIPVVKIDLQHGSLLLMNPPTNKFWYHSLPPRKAASGVRINLTFRRIIPKA